MYVIGIDPRRKTGMVVYDRRKKIISTVLTTDFWGAVGLIKKDYPPSVVFLIVVEVPKTKHVWQDKATTKGSIQRTAFNVGSVCREAELLAEYFIRAGYKVITQHPQGKRSAGEVKKITKYQGSTNEHTRDAIMLVWGI